MELIRRFDLTPSDLPYVEDPFFAEGEVRQIISNSLTAHRLVSANHGRIRLSDSHWGRPRYSEGDLLRDVRDGRVLLLKSSFGDRPFSPLVRYDEAEGRWREASTSTFGLSISYELEQLTRSGLTPARLAAAPAGGIAVGGPPEAATQAPARPAPPVPNRPPRQMMQPPLNAPVPAVAEILSEPGFHVVQNPISLNELKAELYGDLAATPARFDRLNPELRPHLLPGQMIVLGDSNGQECTAEEARLMEVASEVNRETNQLTEDEARFLTENYDFLQFMVSSGAEGLGAGAFAIGQQLNSIQVALGELEELHQRSYTRHGHLNHDSFFRERRAIFQKLDFALGNLARRGLSLDPDTKLKCALGLSTKSIVHHWQSAGVGDIPGYSTHYNRVASAARWTSRAGYAGLALGVTDASLAVREACTFGSDSECEQAPFTEYGRFGGSAFGGSAGGAAGAYLCLGLAGATGVGGLACALIVGGSGSVVGGQLGGQGGQTLGEKFYELIVE